MANVEKRKARISLTSLRIKEIQQCTGIAELAMINLRFLSCVCCFTFFVFIAYFLKPTSVDLLTNTLSFDYFRIKRTDYDIWKLEKNSIIKTLHSMQSNYFLRDKFLNPKCREMFTTENVEKLSYVNFDHQKVEKLETIKSSMDRVAKIIKHRLEKYKANNRLKWPRNRTFFKKTSTKSQGYKMLSDWFSSDFYRSFSKDVPSAVKEDFSITNESRLQQVCKLGINIDKRR